MVFSPSLFFRWLIEFISKGKHGQVVFGDKGLLSLGLFILVVMVTGLAGWFSLGLVQSLVVLVVLFTDGWINGEDGGDCSKPGLSGTEHVG